MKKISIFEYIEMEQKGYQEKFQKIINKAHEHGLTRRAIPQIPVYITPEAYQYFRNKLK